MLTTRSVNAVERSVDVEWSESDSQGSIGAANALPETQSSDRSQAVDHARFRYILTGFGFSGIAVAFHPVSMSGDAALRPTLSSRCLYLPRVRYFQDCGWELQLRYAAVFHALGHLKYSRLDRLPANRPPILRAIIGLIEDARIERLMMDSFPSLGDVWSRFHTASRANSGYWFQGLTSRLARALHEPEYEDSNEWVTEGRNLFEEAAVDLLDCEAFDNVARRLTKRLLELKLPFTAEQYLVAPPYRDDNTALWSFDRDVDLDADAMSKRDTYSVSEKDDYETEELHVSEIEAPDVRRTTYPEWDSTLEKLRPDWVTVVERINHEPVKERHPSDYVRSRSRELAPKRQRETVPDRSIRVIRLHEGDDIDLDAAIGSVTQLRIGAVPDSRVFRRHGRRRRSAVVLLLLDFSKSTDEFIPGSFTTILEMEKRAALFLSELVESNTDRLAVHGFNSDGRHQVNYVHFKDFEEPLGRIQRNRIEEHESGLSTRMGSAIRHATELLQHEQEENKVLLLVTDGAPSDIDVLDDEYLIEDARHAVMDASLRNVGAFCVTLDRLGKPYVRRIFGKRRYLIVDNPSALSRHLTNAFARMINS